MFSQARLELLGCACVMNRLVGLTSENINMEEALHLLALPSRSLLGRREEILKAARLRLLRRGSLRFFRCAPKAKAGGEGS